MKSLYGK
jgi:hypothetical protein